MNSRNVSRYKWDLSTNVGKFSDNFHWLFIIKCYMSRPIAMRFLFHFEHSRYSSTLHSSIDRRLSHTRMCIYQSIPWEALSARRILAFLASFHPRVFHSLSFVPTFVVHMFLRKFSDDLELRTCGDDAIVERVSLHVPRRKVLVSFFFFNRICFYRNKKKTCSLFMCKVPITTSWEY